MQQKYYIFIAVIILVLLAGIFSYPVYFNKGIDFLNNKFSLSLPHFWDKPFVLGLDLQGGVELVYQADLSSVGDRADAMAGLKDVIERRVNMFGVSEPVVLIQGRDRLVVELPGIKDVSSAIKMIGETPYLEFSEQRSEGETQQILDKIKEVEGKTLEELNNIKDWQLVLENPYFKTTELTGKYLVKADVVFDQSTYKPEIQLQFNSEGEKIFEDITGRNIKKPIAIFLDGASIIDTTYDGKIDVQDLYAPIVQDRITGGKAVITGNIDIKTANDIARRLNSGALPVKIGAPISQQTIGPTLGSASLKESLAAGMLGFLAIILYMIIFYRLSGFFASLSLIFYIVIILSLFKLIPVVLTLAGMAGFLLSMGMAVDANILIFSRMKEELKSGNSFGRAVENGTKRAWPSIRDGNLTTILVGLVLFVLGSSFVKGFAFTLIIGNLAGMFTAIFITNLFLRLFDKDKPNNRLWLWI